ncbi:hypothetical protein ACIF70_13195 [Actinacidiphila glaucinigra]|uniref:hypothetical protein n=1 Tax=Actinacidiphila glaucinigra TaxID=235986 RepID=UPI0037C6EBD6
MSVGTRGVQPRDAGVASAMVNTSQQDGRAIGTARFDTITAGATTVRVASHAAETRPLGKRGSVNAAAVRGNSTPIWWAVGALALSTAITVVSERHDRAAGLRSRR